jgi:hypothetical protein
MAAVNPGPAELAVQFHKSRYATDDIGYAVFRGVQSMDGANGINNGVFGAAGGAAPIGAAPPAGEPLAPNPALPKGSYYILAVYQNLAGGGPGTFSYPNPAPNPPTDSVAAELANGEIIRFYAVAAFTNLQGATDSIRRANDPRVAPPPNLVEAIGVLSNAAQANGALAARAAAAGALTPISLENNFHLWRLMVGRPELQLHLQSGAGTAYGYTISDLVLQTNTVRGGVQNVQNAAIPTEVAFNNAANVTVIHGLYNGNGGDVLTITLRRAPVAPAQAPGQIRGGGNLIGGGTDLTGSNLSGTDLTGSNLSGTDLTGGYSAPQYSIGGGRYKTSRTYKKKRSNKNKKNKNDTRK